MRPCGADDRANRRPTFASDARTASMVGAAHQRGNQQGCISQPAWVTPNNMPIPTTAKLPKPKSEDEFEDIVVDFCRLRWRDPHATRNGRRGQRQNSVDVFGHPPWLKGATAGAQCKNTDALSLALVVAE